MAQISANEVKSLDRPLVSIIVPVYNVAPYLERCLESIRAQSDPRFEVLMVDDGSEDDSGRICREIARVDSRFRLMEQGNKGVSRARNLAMDQAMGKYLQFVDGDDYLTLDATETLLHTAESTGADLVIAHFYRVVGERQAPRGHIKEQKVMTRREFAEQMVKAPANYYYGVMWNKLYRRSIVEGNRLRCRNDVAWCEDFLFNLDYLEHVRLIAAIPKPIYYYVKREGSLVSTQATIRRMIQTKRMTFSYYKELYQNLDLYEERKAQIYRYFISAAVDGIPPLPELPSMGPDKETEPM